MASTRMLALLAVGMLIMFTVQAAAQVDMSIIRGDVTPIPKASSPTSAPVSASVDKAASAPVSVANKIVALAPESAPTLTTVILSDIVVAEGPAATLMAVDLTHATPLSTAPASAPVSADHAVKDPYEPTFDNDVSFADNASPPTEPPTVSTAPLNGDTHYPGVFDRTIPANNSFATSELVDNSTTPDSGYTVSREPGHLVSEDTSSPSLADLTYDYNNMAQSFSDAPVDNPSLSSYNDLGTSFAVNDPSSNLWENSEYSTESFSEAGTLVDGPILSSTDLPNAPGYEIDTYQGLPAEYSTSPVDESTEAGHLVSDQGTSEETFYSEKDPPVGYDATETTLTTYTAPKGDNATDSEKGRKQRETAYQIYADRAAAAKEKAKTYHPKPRTPPPPPAVPKPKPNVTTSGGWRCGTATFHGGANAAGTMAGACGFGNLYASGYGDATAALSSTLFKNGLACGACYEVKCANHTACSGESVVVTATNFCPPNPGANAINGGWCNAPNEHFDLAYPTFCKIAAAKAGAVPLSYRRVPCQKLGGIRYTINGNCNFNLVTITNVAGSGVVTKAYMKGSKTGWYPMTRNWGMNWQCTQNFCGQAISFKIVTSDNKTIEAQVADSTWCFGKTYTGPQIY